MSESTNKKARASTEKAVKRWMIVHGKSPVSDDAVMLSVVECATGRPVATGFGESDLIACNAMLSDLSVRCRGLLAIRRMCRVWREELRESAGDIRAEKSKEFFASHKRSPSNERGLATQPAPQMPEKHK